MSRGIKSHLSIDRDYKCVTDKTLRGSGAALWPPLSRQIKNLPACILLWTKTPMRFPSHLLLKMELFSLPLWQRNTEEPDRHRTFAPRAVQTSPLKTKMFVGSTTHRLRCNHFWLTVQVLSFHLVFRWRNENVFHMQSGSHIKVLAVRVFFQN